MEAFKVYLAAVVTTVVAIAGPFAFTSYVGRNAPRFHLGAARCGHRVDASNTGRGTTVLKYDITLGEYVITPQERMEQLVERIKKRLIKIDRLNDIKGVRSGSISADIGVEMALLSDDRAELRAVQKELGIHVAA